MQGKKSIQVTPNYRFPGNYYMNVQESYSSLHLRLGVVVVYTQYAHMHTYTHTHTHTYIYITQMAQTSSGVKVVWESNNSLLRCNFFLSRNSFSYTMESRKGSLLMHQLCGRLEFLYKKSSTIYNITPDTVLQYQNSFCEARNDCVLVITHIRGNVINAIP